MTVNVNNFIQVHGQGKVPVLAVKKPKQSITIAKVAGVSVKESFNFSVVLVYKKNLNLPSATDSRSLVFMYLIWWKMKVFYRVKARQNLIMTTTEK